MSGLVHIRILLATLAAVACVGCVVGFLAGLDRAGARASGEDGEPRHTEAQLDALIDRLTPTATELGKPRPGDWLAEHEEPGETFEQYIHSQPITLRGKRQVIYIQPLGEFTESQRRIVDLTADYMRRFFSAKVEVCPAIALDHLPDGAHRRHPTWGDEQVLTGYILNDILKPRLPDDAATYLAFTATDLWPGKGWNFVFGQASLRGRVGVWSIYRNGDPDAGEDAFRLTLLRTIKTAVHETGHVFSMRHCTAYECVLNGSNNRAESDRHPLQLCPQCVAKVCWATGADPAERYRKLRAFCREQGLVAQADRFETLLGALRAELAAGAAPGDENQGHAKSKIGAEGEAEVSD